ncbi:MAG TPA: [FeFe] hydrogenase H-cluster radical SAM maturase HydE [Thermoguttaceae bacterium]|nr:[FeFe] hydrogenase H-cluster radical SAM maturase HydE [Thermoguttaceae bacterium]
MDGQEILQWLRESDQERLSELWQRADQTRQQHVGPEVHLRGLIEISNHCVRQCAYCGLRRGRNNLPRYRLSDEEIMSCVRIAVNRGYGTVVLQSGEDPWWTGDRVARLIERIKSATPVAVTLSLGERTEEELIRWRRAGADRYFLRFETSNPALFRRLHPPQGEEPSAYGPRAEEHPRLRLLKQLRQIGYEVGSGVLIGLPGQTYEDLAEDIRWFARLDLDMIGVGPYLVHPETPLADRSAWPVASPGHQTPAGEEMTYKVIALARLVCPRANIPATTALGVQGGQRGRRLGLQRGANVLMPNLTPPAYRRLYEIYPHKGQPIGDDPAGLDAFLAELGRYPGRGRGDSPNYRIRCQVVAS